MSGLNVRPLRRQAFTRRTWLPLRSVPRLLRTISVRSSYLVLPLFAFANAGVLLVADVLQGRERLVIAIVAGLVLGKPLGIAVASLLAVRLRVAVKPAEYSFAQLVGAGALSGIGFTMSLFIAGEAFRSAADFAAAKIAVFGSSALAGAIGVAILYAADRHARSSGGDRA